MVDEYTMEATEQYVNRETSDVAQLVPADGPSETGPGWFIKYGRPCAAEFVGVVLFVYVGCMSVQDGVVEIALAHGFMIALLVACYGDISGGHFNPAVTCGVALSGGISPLLAIGYVISQLLGSLLGAGLVKGTLPLDTFTRIGCGAHTLGQGIEPGQGYLCEVVLTTVLVLAVLMSAVDSDGTNALAPLAIGFAVAVDIMAGINVSGASMNPARSFGPAVVVSSVDTEVNYWKYHYVYWVGPATGAVVAAAFYRFILGKSSKRLVLNK